MTWTIYSARVTGAAHTEEDFPCQDAFAVDTAGEVLVAVVADGAGSARHSDEGSRALSDAVIVALRPLAQNVSADKPALEAAVSGAIETVRAQILRPETVLRDFAATLVGCIYQPPRGGFFFHLGDGAAVAARVPDWAGLAVSPPANGEFANETFFYTMDDWRTNLRWTAIPPGADLVALMTDGPMPFVMSLGQEGLFPDFAAPIDAYLSQVAPEAGSADLAATIDSESAREISSDDKTLIWARWRATPAA